MSSYLKHPATVEKKKTDLKLNIQKTKIMASNPITSWQIYREKVETVTDFIFLGSKITVDGDCSYEIKTLALWKESYDKPRQYVKKQRQHFANKGQYSQSYGFSRNHVRKKAEYPGLQGDQTSQS